MKGSFSEDALEQFARLAAEKQGLDFSEGEAYDFARCVRSDGSVYGTGGKCRKGTEAGAKEEEAPKRTPKQENEDYRREAQTRQRIRGELAREIAKKTGKSVTDPEVQKEAVRRLDARRGTPANEAKPAGKPEVPVLTKDDMAKMSVSDLKAVKKAMDERAFGKDSAPLSNTQLQGMSDQNKRINEEIASRVTATPGMAAKVKAAKEKLKAEKAANGGKRTDRLQEERRLERNRQQREMDRKVKETRKPRDRALTAKEQAELDAKTGRLRPSSVAEGIQREQMRAERAARKGTQAGDSGKKV